MSKKEVKEKSVQHLPALNSREHVELMLGTLPPGPTVSGSVRINLTDLDKMRADHAALRKIAEELQMHQKEVRVVFQEHTFGSRETERDYWGKRQFISDEKYTETAVEYRNLTEIENIIEAKAQDKYRKQLTDSRKVIQDLRDTLNAKSSEHTKAITDMQKKHADTVAELKKDIQGLDNYKSVVVQLETWKDNYNRLQVKAEKFEDKITELQKRLRDIANEKGSWWSRLWD